MKSLAGGVILGLRRESLWDTAIAAGTVAVTYVPYLIGWLRQTPALAFAGILFNAIDANVYLAVMQAGRRGAWLLELPYTSEPHAPLFLYEFYLVLGHVSRWLSLPVLAVYHLARGASGLWLLWSVHDYLSLHLSRRATRRLAFVLVCFGSGFGWITQVVAPAGPQGISPIDFWLMDAYVFFSILLVPHFAVAGALGLTLLTALSRAAFGPYRRALLLVTFLSGLGLAVVHPKVVPAFGAVALASAMWLAWRRRRALIAPAPSRSHNSHSLLLTLAAAGLGFAIPGLYYVYALATEPMFASLARQDVTRSPPFSFYVTGYGVASLLGIVGAVKVGCRRRVREALLLIWPVVVMGLLYAPTQIQRRFIFGVQVPLAGLAAIALTGVILPRIRRSRIARWVGRQYSLRRFRLLVLNLILAAAGLSNAVLVAGYALAAWQRSPAMFVPRGVTQAADWLGAVAGNRDFALSAYPTGNYLPARSGARAYLGHWNLTIDFYVKQDLVARIFDGATDPAERERLVRTTAARYLFYGPEERRLGDFDPASAAYLRKRFSTADAAVFEIQP